MRGFFSITRAIITAPMKQKQSFHTFTYKQMNKMTYNTIISQIRLSTSMTGLRLANLFSPLIISSNADVMEDDKNELEQAIKGMLSVSSGQLSCLIS